MVQLTLLVMMVALALLAVEVRELMHALVYFLLMAIAVAFIFLSLNAPLVALFQVLVYAGAIVVLFLIAIMLTERG